MLRASRFGHGGMIPQSPAAVNARRGRQRGRGMPRRKASCKCQIGGKTEIAGSCAAAVFGQTQSPWRIPQQFGISRQRVLRAVSRRNAMRCLPSFLRKLAYWERVSASFALQNSLSKALPCDVWGRGTRFRVEVSLSPKTFPRFQAGKKLSRKKNDFFLQKYVILKNQRL